MRERRFKKKRTPKRVFLVICEGETEKAYVEGLKRHYRLPVAIKTKVSGNYINSRLVSSFVSELGLEKGDDCRIFYIYDFDVPCVADKIQHLQGTAIFTNPCIELWFLLHITDHSRPISSNDVLNLLQNSVSQWRSYAKGNLSAEQLGILLSNKNDAIARAQRLQWPVNPSTNMELFIQALEAENG